MITKILITIKNFSSQ